MEKFHSEEYRDQLAKRLKDVRSDEQTRESAKSILKQESETTIYKASRLIQEIKRELPPEYETFRNQYPPKYEAIESSPDWEVEDISGQIPEKYLLQMELEFMFDFFGLKYYKERQDLQHKIHSAKTMLGLQNIVENPVVSAERRDFLDSITDSNFSDQRNLTHSIRGANTKSFDVASQIEVRDDSFYVLSGHNLYGGIGTPMSILSPYNENCRSFLKEIFCEDVDFVATASMFASDLKSEARRENVNEVDLSDERFRNSVRENAYILLFLAAYPLHIDPSGGKLGLRYPSKYMFQGGSHDISGELPVSFADISGTIVDLRAGKVFKRNRTNPDQIQTDIEHYRSILQKELVKNSITLKVD